MHTCPMVTGPVPHVGGPVLPPGEPTVIIGFMPAARMSDMAVCVGPPDVIVQGSPTVLIGHLMAARLGDPTAHGGVIVLGCPTVMIGAAGGPGGLAVTFLPNGDIQVGKHIVIHGDAAFQAAALNDLTTLGGTPTGRSVLAALDGGTHTTTIQWLDMATAQQNGALAGPVNRTNATNGTGSDTTISYNPDLHDNTYVDENGVHHEIPVSSTLGHELIHAVHNDKGTNLRNNPDPREPGSNQEESQTIGINDHAADPMTENNILNDMGVPVRRTDHDSTVHTRP